MRGDGRSLVLVRGGVETELPRSAREALVRVAEVLASGRGLAVVPVEREPPGSLVQGAEGLRIATEARLGPRMFERFGVDLVTDVMITGQAEVAGPLLDFDLPGLVRPAYKA